MAAKAPKKFVEGNSTPSEHSAALAHLFQLFRSGKIPNVLELMAAISNISEITTPSGECQDCRLSR